MTPRMSEDDLLTAVIDLAKLLGLRVHHSRPARTAQGWRTPISGHKGLPDLVIVGPGGVLWRELKSETGRLTPDQTLWISTLRESRQDAEVWRPVHWLDPIRAELESVAARGASSPARGSVARWCGCGPRWTGCGRWLTSGSAPLVAPAT